MIIDGLIFIFTIVYSYTVYFNCRTVSKLSSELQYISNIFRYLIY